MTFRALSVLAGLSLGLMISISTGIPLNGERASPGLQLASSPTPLALTLSASRATAATAKRKKKGLSAHSILVMVNDEPITLYDVNTRAAFLALQTNIGKDANARFKRLVRSKKTLARFKRMQREVIENNRGKTRDQLIKIFRAKQQRYAQSLQKRAIRASRNSYLPRHRSKAMQELINESLQLQAAKNSNIAIDDARIKKVVAGLAARNKKTTKQFAANIARMGSNISTMKSRMKASFAWRQLVNRRFGSLISINDEQIDNIISSAAIAGGKANVQMRLQQITLSLPNGNDQAAIAQRFSEAERMTRRFKNCKTMSSLTKGVNKARFRKLGLKNANDITEPSRTMLLSTSDGQMTSPTLTSQGIVLYAVCGRRAGKGDDRQRAAAKGELRQKEFTIMAKRYMRDLRAEAHVCRRHMTAYTRTIGPCL